MGRLTPEIAEGKKIIANLMEWLGIQITPSTERTPERVAKMYLEVFKGMYCEPPAITVFKAEESKDTYVCVTDIFFNSFCEHHLLPFSGKCGIVYRVNRAGDVIGLSKLPRIVEFFSSKPQLQEKLTFEVANDVMQRLKPKGVYVAMSAEHTCMTIRGIKARGSKTNTSAMLGDIDKEEAIRLLETKKFFE